MDRREIKELAKAKIKGNKWNILWPILVIGIVESLVERIFKLNPYASIDFTDLEAITKIEIPTSVSIGIAIVAIIFGIVMVSYKKYILNFVRNSKFEIKDIINCLKEKWLNILVAEILMYIIIFVCTLLFVVPGIIMVLAYGMAAYIVIDSDLNGVDSLKQSRAMMKGYKWNYFVFGLSFIGWFLLVPFTLGLLLIWLVPYIIVADTIYYEKLREITNK